MINPLNEHYSFTNPASVYDEESLTALELAGRQGAKINEVVKDQNALRQETETHLEEQDNRITKMNNETMPAKVTEEVQEQIENGTFDRAIDEYAGQLEERLDNLLGSVPEGSTTMDAEVIDIRTGANGKSYANAGTSIREQLKEKLGRMVELADGTDLNNISEHGYYFIPSGKTFYNLPDEKQKDFGGVLIVLYEKASRWYQIYISYDGHNMWYRNFVYGSTFRNWHPCVVSEHRSFDEKTSESLDLNTYIQSGFYHITIREDGQTYNAIPSGESTGVLCVFGGYGTDARYYARLYQLFIGRKNAIYCRARNQDATWNAWDKISSDDTSFTLHTLENGTDLDTIKKSGYYFIPSGQTFLNLPEENTGGLLQVFYERESRFYQLYFSYSGEAIYWRNYVPGSMFRDWKRIGGGIINPSSGSSSPYLVEKVSDTQFYIYRVCATGMIRYKYHRNVNADKNLDTWQMGAIYLCDVDGYPLKQISADGYDNEGVMKLSGEADYIGGIHGDEKFSEVCIFVNGKEYTPETIPNTYADDVRVVVKSELTHADTTNVCMTKTKQTTFDSTGVHVNNRWKLLEDVNIERVRAILLSVNKSCVTKYYDSNVHTFPEVIPASGGDWTDTNITDTYYMGNISAHVWCGERGGDESMYYTQIADFEVRMKSYFDCYVGYSAKTGEELYCQNNFNITC